MSNAKYVAAYREREKAKTEIARAVIVEANNSLYGSQGFFLSLNGGDPDPHHLSRGIEDLKELSNKRWRELTRYSEALNLILKETEGTKTTKGLAIRNIAQEALG